MTIRAMWNFNHIPPGTLTGAVRFTLNSYGITYIAAGFGTFNGTTKIDVLADGSIECYVGGNNSQSPMVSLISVPCSAITDGVSPKSYFGFRVTESPVWSLSTHNLCLSINDILVIAREDPALPAKGTTFYLEVGIDRVKKEITFYVDNVLVKTMSDASVAPIIAAYKDASPWKWGYHGYYSFGNSDKINFSNAYFADEVAGETESARQGPVVISPIIFKSAVGDGWTSSDSKPLLDDLLTPYNTAAALTAPVIRSNDPYGVLQLGLDASIAPSQSIKAVQFLFDGYRHARTTTKPVLTVDDGTNSKVVPPFTFTANTTIDYGLKSGINTVAPDGSNWTLDKLKASKLLVNCTDS